MSKFHWDPDAFMELMGEQVPLYESLQDTVARATGSIGAASILDLGTGTGNTLARVLGLHPTARAVGVDESHDMLEAARTRLAGYDVVLREADLLDPLPQGPFDLVVSALAVHHLDGPGKAELFRRVAAVLQPGGRFVLGDVVIPDDAPDVVLPTSSDYDKPSLVSEQVRWMGDAGLVAQVIWHADDLAVFTADRPLSLRRNGT
jgi:tRNA (cmo5U34)-methyltransferase